jgi:Zn-dependent M16 (insulinase) family peptidase
VVSGLPQLDLCERLAAGFDTEAEAFMTRIEAIRDFLLSRTRLTVSYTGDGAFPAVLDALQRWTGRMRDDPVTDGPTGYAPFPAPPREGLAAPIEVAHCARVMPAPHSSHPDETPLEVATHLVGLDFVLPEIRLKGNAYGAWLRYSSFGRTLSLGSYCDPRIVETLAVFDRVADYVRGVHWGQADIDRAIIAVAKRSERPIRPGPATSDALDRHLNGLTPPVREERFARLRRVTANEARRALLDALEAGRPAAATCVVASRKMLEKANGQMGGAPLEVKDLAV